MDPPAYLPASIDTGSATVECSIGTPLKYASPAPKKKLKRNNYFVGDEPCGIVTTYTGQDIAGVMKTIRSPSLKDPVTGC